MGRREQWGVRGGGLLDAAGRGLRFLPLAEGVSRVGANRVLVYQYLITLVGVASGVVLLGEGLPANKILGGAVILGGVSLARRR
jgi:drug/metabolite transporter (DMT)-like permease